MVGCAASVFEGGKLNPDALAAVRERTERAYGTALNAPLEIQVISRSEVRDAKRAEVRRVFSEEAMRTQQDALTALGLWPDGVDVGAATAAIEDLAVGYYAWKGRRLVLVADAPLPWHVVERNAMREWVLSHELTHALQHQTHPDLFEHAEFFLGQSDLHRGLAGATEGHAVLIATLIRGRSAKFTTPNLYAAEVQRAVSAQATERSSVPALVRDTWHLPYIAGYRLAHAERNAVLDAPPASSEQLLHADRRHQAFEAIDLAALRLTLPDACHFVHEDSVGEIGVSVLLSDLAAPGSSPPSGAAEGWAGDRFLAARCGDHREFVWLTTWDSDADAIEFESAYADVAEAVRVRAGFDGAPRTRRFGRDVQIASPAFAPMADRLLASARRQRVATFDQLLAFFGEPKVAQLTPRI